MVLDALTTAGWRPAPPLADCQIPDEWGQPVCVRTMGQRPCATCSDRPTKEDTDG